MKAPPALEYSRGTAPAHRRRPRTAVLPTLCHLLTPCLPHIAGQPQHAKLLVHTRHTAYKRQLGSGMQVLWITEARGMHRATRASDSRCARLERVHLWGASYRISIASPRMKWTPFAPPRESRRKVQILAVKAPPTRVPWGALSRVIHHSTSPTLRGFR